MTASICGPGCGFPLFLHVLGATVLVGAIATVAIVTWVSLRRPAEQAQLLRRMVFWTFLLVVWPGWLAMRLAGQWVLSLDTYSGIEDADPGWLGVGFIVGDLGVLVLAISTVLAWFAYRRTRPERPKPVTAPIFAGLTTLYLAALAVAWFAMSAKPGA
jgi:putative copper export protein